MNEGKEVKDMTAGLHKKAAKKVLKEAEALGIEIDKKEAPHFKPKTKGSHQLKCKRCDTYFDSMDNLIYRSGYKAYSVCPNCGFKVPVVKITSASGYLRHNETGQIVRKDPKPNKGTSKKERRRLRKESQNG